MRNAVVSVVYETEQSFSLEGFQKLPNGTHPSRLFLFDEIFFLFHLAEISHQLFLANGKRSRKHVSETIE